jgi:hypothetical protein
MLRFTRHLALHFDAPRTRLSYYRQLRLIHEHSQCDPADMTEEMLRDYFLQVKTVKRWKPKTIRQSAAAAKLFFVGMSGHSNINTTMIYLHLTHRSEEDSRELVERLCEELPR